VADLLPEFKVSGAWVDGRGGADQAYPKRGFDNAGTSPAAPGPSETIASHIGHTVALVFWVVQSRQAP
jgi:hypothetical protein